MKSFRKRKLSIKREENHYEQYLYEFIEKFKNVKKMCLTSHQTCGADLIEAMKQLAENNTIEMLHIKYPEVKCFVTPNVTCYALYLSFRFRLYFLANTRPEWFYDEAF